MLERVGVGGRLLIAFGCISAFAVLAAAAAMYAFLATGKVMDEITEREVPSALDALEVSRQTERIVAAAPALLTVLTPEGHQRLKETIGGEEERLKHLLANLKKSGPDSSGGRAFSYLAPTVEALEANLAALNDVVAGRLVVGTRKKELLDDLLKTHSETQRLLAPWLMITDAEITKLRPSVNSPELTPEDRANAGMRLDAASVAFRELRRAELMASVINDTLLQAASEEDENRLKVLVFRVQKSLRDIETVAAQFDPKLQPLLKDRVAEFRELALGPRGIAKTQEQERRHVLEAERLLKENSDLSIQLTAAADGLVQDARRGIVEARQEARTVQALSSGILIAVVISAVFTSVLIVWRYVGQNLIRRLTALSESMLAIAGGNLETPVPAGGEDEIARMGEALEVFRDTAVEVRESNLREIRDARRRLTDAIESISEGFALFDADDRLTVRNSRYEALYPGLADIMKEGVSFETVIRRAAERNVVSGAAGQSEKWIQQRLARHRNPGTAHLQPQSDGRWIQISERKTGDGGTVAVFTDVTELKRQEELIRQAKEQAEQTLQKLQQTQTSLVQAEKLALLGQLVAGIAHEIKNPLNFINNFADLSAELLGELKEVMEKALASVDDGGRADAEDLIATLTDNLKKISQHGGRADAIVKSMLAHSREGPGERRSAEINALVEEGLNLAYHGARAHDQNFNITLERDFDERTGALEVIPQDLNRVLLNLFANGFYATQKRKRENDDPAYQPTLRATTRRADGAVEIRVRDNGTGIPKEVVAKIFTPFFTTKPTGEGTGLGLSLSYDIVVHQHNGTFDVDTREGEYTEFTIRLPGTGSG